MNRLNFLKLAAVGSLTVFTAPLFRKFSFPIPGAALPGDFVSGPGGKLYQGTSDGRILASADGGLAWQCSVNFGENFQVRNLSGTGGGLFAEIGFPGGIFALTSANGIAWQTVG